MAGQQQVPAVGAMEQVLNKASKWVVVGATAGVLLWRRDTAVMWAITGGIVNAANAKLLKRCINQRRPESAMWANKLDPGMPSSHAQSLGFLSTYAALGIVSIAEWRNAAGISLATFVLVSGAYMAYLRVSTGLHTRVQVMVGAAIGSSTAIAWYGMWRRIVQSAVEDLPWATPLLFASFALSAIGFALVMKKWRIGDL